MELIDRYVHAVTRSLPQSQRQEVARELRADIEDMVADRSQGKKPGKTAVEAVLLEMGDPDILAAQYRQGPRYLIGPKWYAAYTQLLVKLLAIIPGLVVAIHFTVRMLTEDAAVMATVVSSVGSGIGVAIQIFFWTTLVFAILEWTGAKPQNEESSWDPSQLPPLPAKRQISRADSVVTMVLTVLFAAAVVAAPAVDAGWFNGASMPMVNPDLRDGWVAAFLALIAASFTLEAFKYRVGNWTPPLVIANVVLNIASAVYFIALVGGQKLINPEFLSFMKVSNPGGGWTIDSILVASIVGLLAWGATESMVKGWQLRKQA